MSAPSPTFARSLATAVGALVVALLATMQALALIPAAQARPADVGSPSGGDPYFRLDGNGGYQVRHYRIHDRYRPGTDRLRGRTELVATATQRLRVFHLDLVLTPDRVRVDGAPARFSKPRRHELRIVPERPVAAGHRFTVAVRYHGRPSRRHAEGMTPGTDLYFHRRGETVAMGEPQNGAWWFAANETPSDKATFSVRVDVPRGRQAVSGGELVSRRVDDGWTSWRWQVTEPITTYLAFFAAGRFRLERGTSGGLPYTYAVSRRLTRDQQQESLRLLRRTSGIVTWLERRFGAYPYRSVGGVVAGIGVDYALETATRPVYPFVGGTDEDNVLLLVHENAHQWFGNDVSVRRWRDVWLNEGFATYAEWLWTARHGGDSVADQLQQAYDDRPSSSSFWDAPVFDPGADRMWDDPTYVRGAMTLAALRSRLGGAVFADLLRTWVVRHGTSHDRSGHGTTAQFRALAERLSGEQLDDFFDAWLDTTTRPAHTAANGF